MDPYITSLVLGAAGLSIMGLSGLGRHGHAVGSSSHGHVHGVGHGHGGHHVGVSNGHGHAGHAHGGHAHGHLHGGSLMSRALMLMSPRILFSVLLGLGTTGVVLRPVLGGPLLFLAALAGGILLERALVAPLWRFTMGFASQPAQTLEHAVLDEGTAVTNFDAHGNGIVSVELDGQVVQILGTLQASDRAMGVRVRAGTRLRIEDVDTTRNRCTVSVR